MRDVGTGVNVDKSEFGEWSILIKCRPGYNTALSKGKQMYHQGREMKRKFFRKGTGE